MSCGDHSVADTGRSGVQCSYLLRLNWSKLLYKKSSGRRYLFSNAAETKFHCRRKEDTLLCFCRLVDVAFFSPKLHLSKGKRTLLVRKN